MEFKDLAEKEQRQDKQGRRGREERVGTANQSGLESLPEPRGVHSPHEFLNFFFLFFFFFFGLFRASPTAYGSSQARGRIAAVAANLHHSPSNWGSEPCLQPTPQVMATPDP